VGYFKEEDCLSILKGYEDLVFELNKIIKTLRES
jgi:hypothetical protein